MRESAGSPRLKRIREALLAAPYELCTAKAELITAYLSGTARRARAGGRSRPASASARRALDRAHLALYSRALRRNRSREIPPRLEFAVGNLLVAAQRALDRFGAKPRALELAGAFAHTLDHLPTRIYPDELIVGNLTTRRIGAAIHPDYGGLLLLPEIRALARRATNPILVDDDQTRALEETVFPYWFHRSILARAPLHGGARSLREAFRGDRFIVTQFAGISHLTPDYPKILKLGLRGILGEIESRLADQRKTRRAAVPLEAMRLSVQAAIRFGQRWKAETESLAMKEPDPARRRELTEIAGVLSRVPEWPATTFHEALQSLFLAHAMIHQESFQHGVSFGRLDQYLLPFFARDRAAGRLSEDRAVELLGCFLAKCAETVPLFFDRATEYFSGLSSASGITIGGRLADGSDASNELSRLILKAYDLVRLRQPNLHLRWHPGMGRELLSLARDTLAKGGGMPAFFNDLAIERSLVAGGVSPQDAREYSIVGCAEWGVPGKSFPAAGAAFVSLPHALARSLSTDGGASAEAAFSGFRAELRRTLAAVADANGAIERAHAAERPTPFLSCIVDGCLESARDVTAGGARLNSTGIQGVGVADVADALSSMSQATEVDAAAGGSHETPWIGHYGNDSPRSSAWAARIARAFSEEVARLAHPRPGGRYLAGFWSMTTHQGFGRRLGALPGGRTPGAPLANGISPGTGRDRLGPTAMLNSIAAIPPECAPNGAVANLRLDPAAVKGEAGLAVFGGLLAGYFGQGGLQAQFNIVDQALLEDARRNPGKHPGLVVRISGYSAYFDDLTDAMKDEILSRSRSDGA